MKYHNDQLRDALAAEYALGTLQGLPRRRFERSLKDDPDLRHRVAAWQTRLAPLDDTMAPVQPPARVWRQIAGRIHPQARRRSAFWDSLGFWRGTALASATAAIILAVALLAAVPRPETMVVVMSDDAYRPMITVSWQTKQERDKRLRVRVIGHQTMDPETAWELWMIPGEGKQPVSLGLITTHETQTVHVPQNLASAVNAAWGLAMSVEPKGGSPTGLPTGPVLYEGQCTKL
jgi:anti-sigma-K factor RskA